jgi:lauroyl/myristoyl acyltransferase
MSHVGNWEVASHLLKNRNYRLMLYIGEKQAQQIEKMQKDALERKRIEVVRITSEEISPLDGLAALNFLRGGGFVAMAGDRLWSGKSIVDAPLFDRRVSFPAAPHALALITGAPLLTFFGLRLVNGQYEFSVSAPYWVRAEDRSQKKRAVEESVRRYARILEQVIIRHPTQWYTFEPYFGPPWDSPPEQN